MLRNWTCYVTGHVTLLHIILCSKWARISLFNFKRRLGSVIVAVLNIMFAYYWKFSKTELFLDWLDSYKTISLIILKKHLQDSSDSSEEKALKLIENISTTKQSLSANVFWSANLHISPIIYQKIVQNSRWVDKSPAFLLMFLVFYVTAIIIIHNNTI